MTDLKNRLENIKYKTLWLEENIYAKLNKTDKEKSFFVVRPCLLTYDQVLSALNTNKNITLESGCLFNDDLNTTSNNIAEEILMNLNIQGINIDFHTIYEQQYCDQNTFRYRLTKIIDLKTGKLLC